MRRPRYFLNTILGVVIAAGCSNAPLAPDREEPRMQASLVSNLLPGSCPDQVSDQESEVIGRNGGTLHIGPHTLVVPPLALSQDVKITARTGGKAGNAIEFGPAGLRFNTYAKLTFSVANCRGWGLLKLPLVVYTDNLLSILEIEPSVLNNSNKTVTGFITHFSQYAVAY